MRGKINGVKEYIANCFAINKNNKDYNDCIEDILRKHLPDTCFVNNKEKDNIDLENI